MGGDALLWHRIQFGFTISFHYLFPQLTMGLALLIVVFKVLGLRAGGAVCNDCARFWGRIFGINFAVGVVTGIPLEFQFGTNWARFSEFAGGVIGQTLAMEAVFAFFLESTFLGLFLFGERRLGLRGHLLAAVALFLGAWLSGYFIIASNAFMQHPIGYAVDSAGKLQIAHFGNFLLNPWALWQYAHNMTASVITASFVVSGVAAYWALMGQHLEHAQACLRVGVLSGLISCLLIIFPTGDQQGKMVARHQPVTLAAMEGLFHSGNDLAIIGQPNLPRGELENPIVVPGILSFLVYGTFGNNVKGLEDFPRNEWPDSVELVYYCYHIMVGLGTLFLLVMAIAALLLWRGRLQQSRPILWVLMLAVPFPYISTTAGWWTAELGRQPWIVHGLQRTAAGGSPQVSSGDVTFTLLGFIGLYLVLGLLFLFLVLREVGRGPGERRGVSPPVRSPAQP